MKENQIKLCPFCESTMMLFEDETNDGKPYLECPTCGLKFKLEGFNEKPVEIKGK